MTENCEKTLSDTVIIAWNPKSGRQSREILVRELMTRLQGENLVVHLESDLSAIKSLVESAKAESRLRCVVSAGGDGTIRLLADVLGSETPFALLPLGTENLLAKYLKVTAHPDEIAATIVANNCRKIDAARANGQLFLIVLSCGFDAEVVALTHKRRTGHIRKRSYVPSVLEAIRRYRYPPLKICADDLEWEVECRWAFIFNVPKYALDLAIVPDAVVDDGKLDVCTFAKGGLFSGLGYFFSVLFRQHRRFAKSRQFLASKIAIESDVPVAFQVDGDPGGTTPVEIKVLPQYLSLLIPLDK